MLVRPRSIFLSVLFGVLFVCPMCIRGQGIPKNPPTPDAPRPKVLLPPLSEVPPITGGGRVKWVLASSFGPTSLASGVVSAAWSTGFNDPEEYGPHWEGFAKRYGMRFTGVATSNAMEAGLGALWGEDPRYFPTRNASFGARVKNVFVMTLMARGSDGRLHMAYARAAAITGSNFLSNTWRVTSDATNGKALERTAAGYLGRLGSNAFAEFWPSVRRRVFKR